MIVNKFSILLLFMAGLSLLLGIVLVGVALWAARDIRRGRSQQDASRAERMIHLARLVGVVALGVLGLSWPLFYAMLASFVPEIPGAMCMYGVTKVMPRLTLLIQIAFPAVVFAFGAWWLVESGRRQAGLLVRHIIGMLSLALVGLLAAATSGTEVYYVLNMESLNEVSCCSSLGDRESSKVQAPAFYLPWSISESAWHGTLVTGFFGGVPILSFWLLRRRRAAAGRRRWWLLAESVALLAIAIGLGWTTLVALADVLAARLMRLPFHNCVYCLVTNGRVPDAALILGNLAIGTLAAGWTAVLAAALQIGAPVCDTTLRRVQVLAATTLLAGVLMIAIHLGISGW